MMNDTVREELQTKISTSPQQRNGNEIPPLVKSRPVATPPAAVVTPPLKRGPDTDALVAPKTNPTLVDFQARNATLPDWRLQVQNLVQQRKGCKDNGQNAPVRGSEAAATAPARIVKPQQPAPIIESSDPRVANAMRRIETSRNTFLPAKDRVDRAPLQKRQPNAVHRFNVVSPTSAAAAPAKTPVISKPEPQRVVTLPQAEEQVDTNKLPPITIRPDAPEEPALETRMPRPDDGRPESMEITRIRIRTDIDETAIDDPAGVSDDEIEDLAPFSMRFSAGVFDLIIGTFAGMLALSPLAFTSQNWFSATAIIVSSATVSLVLFLYMTISLGFYGRTFGMRLFALELVDAVENEYPTLRQAAVNSFVFLLSFALAGAGFLTVFFNEEKRAVHDLVSGTIMVKEF